MIANHYNYCGVLDDHNVYWHGCGIQHGLSLEEIWRRKMWENGIFAFISAVSKMNVYLAMIYFW